MALKQYFPNVSQEAAALYEGLNQPGPIPRVSYSAGRGVAQEFVFVTVMAMCC